MCLTCASLIAAVQYTPLLPAVATGTIEDRSIVEPVRRIIRKKVCHWPATSHLPVASCDA